MRCSQSARPFSLACWSLVALLGAASCGSGQPNGSMSHQSEALNQNDLTASDKGRFFWKGEWLSGQPVAAKAASARILFHNAQGVEASTVVIQDAKLKMTCCREGGSGTLQVQGETGTNPALRDIGEIKATKSGTWMLTFTAIVDGAEADTGVWKFDVVAP